MLVTKLKNSRKFAVGLILAVLLGSACIMVAFYPMFQGVVDTTAQSKASLDALTDIGNHLLQGNSFLYSEVADETKQSDIMQNYGEDRYFLLVKYLDYEAFDFEGNALREKNSKTVLERLLQKETEYAFRIAFLYDDEGALRVEVDGSALSEEECYGVENFLYQQEAEFYYPMDAPRSVKIVYAFTEENLEKYIKEFDWSGQEWRKAETLSNDEVYLVFEWVLCLFVLGMACLIPCNKNWNIGEQKIFHAPLEIVILVLGYLVSEEQRWSFVVVRTMEVSSSMGINIEKAGNVAMWFCIFALVYWGATCIRAMFTMKKAYWKERTLCGRVFYWARNRKEPLGEQVKQSAGDATGLLKKIWKSVCAVMKQVYDWVMHLDFRDRTNQTILRIVGTNFVVLFFITIFWYHRFTVLALYSLILFLFLRKFFRDTQKKYKLLLAATNGLAQGNLDVQIEGDMGIFNPLKLEIQKIQRGFKRAVEEEVKSERMKTELITNVSHDLKTPLTAIITYIDLLKQEKDPKKQEEYLGVLERKSLRLKVLIEDLFEISKATSRNVTMNYMRADIVELLKQVSLENKGKIEEANLDFRWNLPGEKVVMLLDIQKTYRIFENLIVNITKYAMPHTRVYVDLLDEGGQVLISMKNVSAAELNFNTEEITDRFVRGDTARNTEGSGLGLAIAKSFTELQGGALVISTDADLFKVSIWLPRREEDAHNS